MLHGVLRNAIRNFSAKKEFFSVPVVSLSFLGYFILLFSGGKMEKTLFLRFVQEQQSDLLGQGYGNFLKSRRMSWARLAA